VQADSLANVVVQPNDVLLNITGASVARCCTVPEDAVPARVNQHVAIIRPHGNRLSPQFLQYLLVSNTYKDRLLSTGEGAGATRQALTKAQLQGFLVEFPESLQEQARIVAILDEAFDGIGTAKANAEKNLRNARELFESKLFALLGQNVAGWPSKTLRAVSVDFGRGKSRHRPRNDPKLYGGPYPFIQTGDVRGAEHLITEYTQTYSEAGLAQSKLWPKGTLCITIAANIAETGILDFDSCFPDSVIGVVVDESQTSSKYLEYMLHTVKADLKAKGKGSAQDNINLATFENERFPFPDLESQARVVRLLDDLSAEVQRLEGLCVLKLNALDALKKSLLHQAFTGQLVRATTLSCEPVAS
jgi:type I restriction enzyme S subunit